MPLGFSVHNELIQFAFEALVLFLIAGQIIPQLRVSVVRLLGRLKAGFRATFARLPATMLIVLGALDLLASISFVGFIVVSLFSVIVAIINAGELW